MNLEKLVQENINFKLGKNKLNEIVRLIFEIHRREKISFLNILNSLEIKKILEDEKLSYLQKFKLLKKYLISRRYPNIPEEKWKYIYLSKLKVSKDAPSCYKEFSPEKIFIMEEVKDFEFTKKILKKLPYTDVEYIKNLKELKEKNYLQKYELKKNHLFIFKEKFDFLKKCPCTKNALSCNYYIVNLGFGCPYDCTYCYLQHYTNFPGIFLEADIENFLNNLENILKGYRFLRCGTGEFTDSLALDNLTEYSKVLVPFFSRKNVFFELKTKSKNINNLIGLQHNQKVVISWSLNSEKIIEEEEKGCASLSERILSAKECQRYGYMIGFHIDPIIFYEGWEEDYKKMLEEIFKNIKGDISWISLGTLRFNPELKKIIEHRHPQTDIIYQEQILGFDKKLRYEESLRVKIYKKMIEWIREANKKVPLYLCMEENSVWEKSGLKFPVSKCFKNSFKN